MPPLRLAVLAALSGVTAALSASSAAAQSTATSPQPIGRPKPAASHPAVKSLPPFIRSARTKINPIDRAEMVWIPAGEFLMGHIKDADDNPPRRVFLSGYYIYKNLVTVAQYRKFCRATGRKMPDAPPWGWKDKHPVVNVTWYDAEAYCKWAKVQLPTDAQWEKAARGTDGRNYPWGNTFDPKRLRTRLRDSPDSLLEEEVVPTAPVGSYPSGASPYGILDMAGNAPQWCQSWFRLDYYKTAPKRDPQGPPGGWQRSIRGGPRPGWQPESYRCSFMVSDSPKVANLLRGFRCAAPGP